MSELELLDCDEYDDDDDSARGARESSGRDAEGAAHRRAAATAGADASFAPSSGAEAATGGGVASEEQLPSLPPRPMMRPGFLEAVQVLPTAAAAAAAAAAAPVAVAVAAPAAAHGGGGGSHAASQHLTELEAHALGMAMAPGAAAAGDDVTMEQLKEIEDFDGFGRRFGDALGSVCGPTVRRRLWTKADFMHIHALSGAYFLFIGLPWLFLSHVSAFTSGNAAGVAATNAAMAEYPDEIAVAGLNAAHALADQLDYSSPFLVLLLASGAVNALSAVPMARFSSNDVMDLSDLKANGFTLGGTGLTLMCCWAAWWFSGSYPTELHALDPAFFVVWAFVCIATTWNWETMLSQNFEANERSGRKFAKVSEEEMREKTILYRLASWPNLTQLLFLASPCFGGEAWMARVLEQYPLERTPMYHYCIASAMGYALSMFSETLRDRKLVSLRVDLIILVIGFIFPMISVITDGLTYGSAVTAWAPDYWLIFGK